MQLENDTIVAISTAPGRGAIGIVRLSGPEATAIARRICKMSKPLAPGRVRLAGLMDEAGQVLDEAVVTLWAAPRSYTSEDVVEIACHGAPVVLDHVLRRCVVAGARLANPGEFTQRAFLSGRIDLAQAEAVNDLIAAQTLEQARLAAAQLGGALAQTLEPIKQSLILLIASLEAGIDFAEDDLDVVPDATIDAQLIEIITPLQALADSYAFGRVVRAGFTLAIVGRPNAGKSSLFNRLLRRERAIVTARAGTTRDSISETFSLGGIPVQLVDTAGLRETAQDEVEVLGIARTRAIVGDADVVLHVIDSTRGTDQEDEALQQQLEGRKSLIVWNKCDLVEAAGGLRVSALTGEGISGLEKTILELVGGAHVVDSAMITNLRQHQAIEEALAALRRAQDALKRFIPHDLLLLDMHASLEAIGTLTGQTSTEDVLRVIFSTFCIGK